MGDLEAAKLLGYLQAISTDFAAGYTSHMPRTFIIFDALQNQYRGYDYEMNEVSKLNYLLILLHYETI